MTVIALDGPAGSGKSTTARLVAQRLGCEVLDTGAMYRGVTWAVLQAGVDPTCSEEATAIAERISVEVGGGLTKVDGVDVSDAIRGPAVSAAVSAVSAHPGVRNVLRDLQRAWMATHGGGVVEGRDIGTVVFPDADLKVFLTASIEVRARRRGLEGHLSEDEASRNIEARDLADSSRADSPLQEAGDSVVVDTSDLSINEVVDTIVRLNSKPEGNR